MSVRISKNERLRLLKLWDEGQTEEVEKAGYTVRKIKGDKIQLKRIITQEEKEERKKKIVKKKVIEEEEINEDDDEEIQPPPKQAPQPSKKFRNKKCYGKGPDIFEGLTVKEKMDKINEYTEDGIKRKNEKMLKSKAIQDMITKPKIKNEKEDIYLEENPKPNIL
ncbi:MAG: hypothetical protein LBR15_00565 [Methanobrevibacter sp.]|jgi:hypothetical protein|nr:hypothetical protein [Candidatus Methanovirga australis]